jgi:flagellar hook-basal body complex protein FliE
MLLKRKDIVRLFWAIKSLPRTESIKVGYAFSKNSRKLQTVIDALDEARDNANKPDEKFAAYETARVELAEKFAQVGADDKPVIHEQRFIIDPSKQEEFNTAFAALRKKHKPAIDLQEKKNQEYEAFIKGEEEIDLHKIALSDIESSYESLDQSTIEGIFELIEE